MNSQSRPLTFVLVAAICLIYAAALPFSLPELDFYNYAWLEHIRARGPFRVFAEPFSNYSPPNLYLLSALSPLNLSALWTIKLIALTGVVLLFLAARELLKELGAGEPVVGALSVALLPTVVLNAPFLGQTDAYWVAPSLMCVVATIQKRTVFAAAWFGLAFALKAQAIFLAPFLASVFIRERSLAGLCVVVLSYLGALLPAVLAGWPLLDAATVYVRQAGTPALLSNAPNLWATVTMFDPTGDWTKTIVLPALGLTALGGLALLVRARDFPLVTLALLSALLVPFLLPNMHERYFLLADVLAFCLAISGKLPGRVFGLVIAGSVLAIAGYLIGSSILAGLSGLLMTVAIALIVCGSRLGADPPGSENRSQFR